MGLLLLGFHASFVVLWLLFSGEEKQLAHMLLICLCVCVCVTPVSSFLVSRSVERLLTHNPDRLLLKTAVG